MERTVKIPYYLENIYDLDYFIKPVQAKQNCIMRFAYNRIEDNPKIKQTEITAKLNAMNHIFLDSWFKQCAYKKALKLYKGKIALDKENGKVSTVVFGGKPLFYRRCEKKISNEQFVEERESPIYIEGESDKYGNRKVTLQMEDDKVIFHVARYMSIELLLPRLKESFRNILVDLQEMAQQKLIPITFELDSNNIYITYDDIKLFDYRKNRKITVVKEQVIDKDTKQVRDECVEYVEQIVSEYKYRKISNRIMSIDNNPNYLGVSIIDWESETDFQVMSAFIFDIKEINDDQMKIKKVRKDLIKAGIQSQDRRYILSHLNKKVTNKRQHECVEIAKKLVNIAKSYHVEYVAMEELQLKSKDLGKGRKLNRLINNNWQRNLLSDQLQKRLQRFDIGYQEIYPQYSSFIGNILYRGLGFPDPVLASVEIGRRCFQFINKYIKNSDITKDIRSKVDKILYPDLVKNMKVVSQSLEELRYDNKCEIKCWKELKHELENSEIKYRVSIEQVPVQEEFRLSSTIKSKVKLYNYA